MLIAAAAIFIIVWAWIIWEIRTSPVMPKDWMNEPTDIDDKYDEWWPDADIE